MKWVIQNVVIAHYDSLFTNNQAEDELQAYTLHQLLFTVTVSSLVIDKCASMEKRKVCPVDSSSDRAAQSSATTLQDAISYFSIGQSATDASQARLTSSNENPLDDIENAWLNTKNRLDFEELSFTGTVISAAAHIPYIVGMTNDGKFELSPRPVKSVLRDTLSSLSSSPTWHHILVGWTGKVLPACVAEFRDSLSQDDTTSPATSEDSQVSNAVIYDCNRLRFSGASSHHIEVESLANNEISVSSQQRGELEALLGHEFKGKIVPVWMGDWADEKRDVLDLIDQDRWHAYAENQLHSGLNGTAPENPSPDEQAFADYLRMNESVADAIVKVYRPGDMIWVHDYHLMLLPDILRRRIPSACIAYFHYTNWTDEEALTKVFSFETVAARTLGATAVGLSAESIRQRAQNYYHNVLRLETIENDVVRKDNRHVRLVSVHLVSQQDQESPSSNAERQQYSDTHEAAASSVSPQAHDVAKTTGQALYLDNQTKPREQKSLTNHFTPNNFSELVDVFITQTCISFAGSAHLQGVRNLDVDALAARFSSSGKRLLMFDYDGTLTPIVNDPDAALPTEKLLTALHKLAADSRNEVWLISGRSRAFLMKLFGEIQGLGLSAEHGSFTRCPSGTDWKNLAASMDMGWKEEAGQVFQELVDQVDGSWIERKEVAMVWHYRNAINHEACLAKATVVKALLEREKLKKWDVEVMLGKANIEVRPRFLNKGVTAAGLVDETFLETTSGFIFCAGDDVTDEGISLYPSWT